MAETSNRTSPWLIAWRVIFTFALIGCIVFIFSNSMQVAAVSEGASGRVLDFMQKVLRKLGMPGVANHLTMHIIRKLAHFSEYLLEGFLFMLCLRVYTKHVIKHVSWPILGGLLTALTDETIQLSLPKSSVSKADSSRLQSASQRRWVIPFVLFWNRSGQTLYQSANTVSFKIWV